MITGRPGSGKTTLVKRVIDELSIKPVGFYTEEIRRNGRRTGFRIRSLTPNLERMEGILARAGEKSSYRFGRYGVNRRDLEEVGARALEEGLASRTLVVIDEIGNMEIVSPRFQRAVIACLESTRPVLGVIKAGAGPFVSQIKSRPDIELMELKREKYSLLRSYLIEKLKRLIGDIG